MAKDLHILRRRDENVSESDDLERAGVGKSARAIAYQRFRVVHA